MNSFADAHADNLLFCFMGCVDGCQIGIDDNTIRGDDEDRVLDGIKKLVAFTGRAGEVRALRTVDCGGFRHEGSICHFFIPRLIPEFFLPHCRRHSCRNVS